MKVTCYLILLPVFLFTSFCKTQSKGGIKISQSEYSMKAMALAGIDTLKISEPGITEKYWKLAVIFGDPVVWNENFNQEPYLILKTEGNRVIGSDGCNRLMGSYELKKGNHLSFSEIGSTKMACMNMKTEKQ